MTPRISVVVPTFNRRARLALVLQGLADQEPVPGGLEVVVVSDASTDGTDDDLRAGRTPVPVVPVLQERNGGPAVARNAGVQAATGDLVLFLDDDVVPDPGLVRAHLDAHDRLGPGVVVIGPMLTPDGVVLQPWVRWEQAMLQKQYDAMTAGRWSATARQFYTGNASLARGLVVEAGGFDHRFRRAEDVELAYRLADAGVRFVFEPAAVGHHHAERSFASWMAMASAYGHADVVFARDHGRAWLLDAVRREYQERPAAVRAITRIGLAARPLAAGLAEAFRLASWTAERLHRPRWSQHALSALFNLRYYEGARDELGSTRLLLTPPSAPEPPLSTGRAA